MAKITLQGTPIKTAGDLGSLGEKAPDFTLTASDLGDIKLSSYAGKKVILNIFPSVDTGVCATSIRKFNDEIAKREGEVVVLCISRDTPFAQARFCNTEGLNHVITAAEMKDNSFSKAYPVLFVDGPLQGLFSRAIIVIDESRNIIHREQVAETTNEPDYAAALAVL